MQNDTLTMDKNTAKAIVGKSGASTKLPSKYRATPGACAYGFNVKGSNVTIKNSEANAIYSM